MKPGIHPNYEKTTIDVYKRQPWVPLRTSVPLSLLKMDMT